MLGGRRTRYFARPLAAEVQAFLGNNGTHLMGAAAGLRTTTSKRVQHQPPKQDCERYARNSVCLVSTLTAALPIRGGLPAPFVEPLDIRPCFCKYRNMVNSQSKKLIEQVVKYADMFSAMGTEPRLRIMQVLLSAHPEGLVVGEIQQELDIPNSTLSHHLDKLKAEDLVRVRRESTFLHYTANTEALQELLQFLYAECCTRNKALKPESIIQICK
jgi:ArsR family transcriptional regulator